MLYLYRIGCGSMASFLIHMCVCNEVNKIIKKDERKILIGSIAPDFAKLIGIDRSVTHFGEYPDCDIDLFLSKYKDSMNDDFVLGYFIHLYTDYLWDELLIKKIYKDGIVTMIDGSKINYDGDICDFLYKDYDSLIEEIIETYNMNLNFLKEDIPKIPYIIDEIPMDKLDVVVKRADELVSKKVKNKLHVLDMKLIREFISLSKNEIINKIV